MTKNQAAVYGLGPSDFAVIRLLQDGSEWTDNVAARTLSISASAVSGTVATSLSTGGC